MDASSPAEQVLSPIERMKTTAQLMGLVRERQTVKGADPVTALRAARIASQIVALLRRLGSGAPATPARAAFTLEGGPDLPAKPRATTAHLYDFDPNRPHAQRKKDNTAAMELLRMIERGEVPAELTEEQKAILAKYSGTGGNLVGADGKKGSAYEYYTPKPIAKGMWDLLREMGFRGGKVLDPCAGVGIFGATAPPNAAMEAVELNETSGRINQLVNGGPGFNAIVSPFEAVATRTADEIYDAVVSNVPFGGVHDRGANRKIDPRYQDQPLETYFILRSLEKLKPGGLAAFIVPPRIVSGKGGREEQLRIAMSYVAEFRGAYRLPNSVFGTADADTITDVIVLRKFSRPALEKIGELKEQRPQALVDARVQWPEFIAGDYFRGEGRRFVLGEFRAKDPSKFRDVDRVISDQSVGNIAKLLRKFGESRIDWAMLDATETQPLVYQDGDTMTLAGQTLEMRDGVWVALDRPASSDRFDGLGQVVTSAAVACTNGVTWDDASAYVRHLRERSMEMDMPIWLRSAHTDTIALEEGRRAGAWQALLAGMAAVEVTQQHAGTPGFNYLEEYPVVSEALKVAAPTARKTFAGFSRDSKAALVKVGIVYSRKGGFSALWRGEARADVTEGEVLSEDKQVEAVKYLSQAPTLEVGALQAILGEEFNPLEHDEWCVSSDGTMATKADDYYVGNYGDFLRRIDAEIQAAPGGPLRDKLLRQKAAARDRVATVDPSGLRFNLFSPFVGMEEKAEFLRRFFHPAFSVGYDEDGGMVIVCDIGSPKTEQERQLKRLAEWLKKGNLSTRTSKEEAEKSPELERARLDMLRQMVQKANSQFDQWVKANPLIMERLRSTANDPQRVYFREVDDTAPLTVGGMSEGVKLHGYQNAFVRKQARSFGGINGFDVGLGKTFTALACAQYVQSIGVKKKTMFVVPNTVLSNWRREAGRAYATLDDCLFVGLDLGADGKARVDSGNYARDFTVILENRHRKIFCTLEAFKAIPLRDQTVEAYDRYLMSVDPSYADAERKADSERANSKRAEATSGTGAKSAAIPYFEDMGIDSLVMDEAHQFKNSKNTVDFSGAKFLSVAEASQRGLDIQMKAWYVRGLSPLNDGVLALTATPITNSPLEIYSMLCLAAGEEKVHNLCLGAKGADAFMNVMCDIVQEDEATIDGRIKPYNVFRGLQNVELLRNALATVATIKTAADVKDGGDDLRLPEAPENKTSVQLTPATLNTLNLYKSAYRAARALMRDKAVDQEDMKALTEVGAKFGEPTELIGHPFNLINKMTLLIADPDLDQRGTFYSISAPQTDLAKAVVAAFNKLGRIEVRTMAGPLTDKTAIVGNKTVRDGDSETVMVRIRVEAKVTPDGRIALDTMDHGLQTEFEAVADKQGLELDCSIPPKLAALLENVRREEANPRSASGRVKQLIFCDILPMHAKIKRLLVKRAGVSAASIAIVSGQTIKNPEQMQGIQDGFNAEGEENRYRIIIANEKAEVGINLQKGTQAIHHLTIGWTPDSTIQRNGRGVRQGNTTARVNIYVYDADGTFDEYKRTLTSKKADWIGSVMDAQGGNDIQIAAGLTADEYDELINSVGDADAVRAIRERAELKERQQRAESARARQVINVQTAESQRQFLKKFDTADKWVVAKAMELYDLRMSIRLMELRSEGKVSANSLIKLQTRIAELKARATALESDLNQSATFKVYAYDSQSGKSKETLVSVMEVLKPSAGYKTGAKLRESLEDALRYRAKANDDGPLINEYQAERDQAQAMVEEAHKDFARIAASSPGGYSSEMLAAIRDGKAAVLDGRLYVGGMFVRDKKGSLAILMDGTSIVRLGVTRTVSVADAVRGGWTFIMPGEAGYEEALREAAALDDAAGGLSPAEAEKLFSRINPAVGAHRAKKTMIRYTDATQVVLPSPHFVHPINVKAPGVSDAFKSIAASQASVVSWDGSAALIASDVEVTLDKTYRAIEAKILPLRDYARAHGLRLTPQDFIVMAYGEVAMGSTNFMVPTLSRMAEWPGDWSLFDAAASPGELEALLPQVLSAAAPWLDPGSRDLLDFLPPAGRAHFNDRMDLLRAEAVRAARAAAAAQRAATDGAEEPGPVEESAKVAGITPNAKGLIGLQGNTKPNKEIIKAAARDAGGYARWNGTAGQWDVPAKTWAVLMSKHPAVAQQLQVVPA